MSCIGLAKKIRSLNSSPRERSGQHAAVVADTFDMSAGVFIFVFRRAGHRYDGFQIALLKISGPFPHAHFKVVVIIVQDFLRQAHFQHVAHARQHLGKLERLADEILRAGLERSQLVDRLSRDDQHRQAAVRFKLLEPLHHLKSVHAGHQKIEQDQVRDEARRPRKGLSLRRRRYSRRPPAFA